MKYECNQRVLHSGFEVTILRHVSGSLWEIRTPGGVKVTCESELSES